MPPLCVSICPFETSTYDVGGLLAVTSRNDTNAVNLVGVPVRIRR